VIVGESTTEHAPSDAHQRTRHQRRIVVGVRGAGLRDFSLPPRRRRDRGHRSHPSLVTMLHRRCSDQGPTRLGEAMAWSCLSRWSVWVGNRRGVGLPHTDLTAKQETRGRVLIEELPACRCLCGAPLFRLERDGRSEWVRCLAGHGPFALSPGDYEAGEPVASAYPHPWGWRRTDGYRPVTRAVVCPSQPTVSHALGLPPTPRRAVGRGPQSARWRSWSCGCGPTVTTRATA